VGDDSLIDGKYRLGEVIFSTRATVIHRAEHTRIQRDVEIKLLAASCPIDGPEAERMLREGRVVGSVTQRNIQSVVDSGVHEDGRPFVVYEALKGKTLGQLIAEHPKGMELPRASLIINQLLDAVAAMHAEGVVHRTIGPESAIVVEVRGADLLKLRFFQDATFAKEEKRDAPTFLPPNEYIPPELVGGGRYDERADLYAVGALYRALLTGNPKGKLTNVTDTPRRAIQQAMAQRPLERFPEADLFQLVLAIVLGHRTVRDDGEVHEDPLAADLSYLKKRRPTAVSQHDGELPNARGVGEARLELLAVLLVIEAVYKTLGDRWPELITRVPEVEQLLPGSGNTDLNRTRGISLTLVTSILAAVDELAGQNDLSLLAKLGERVGQRGFTRLSPDIAAAEGPKELIRLFPKLWATLSRQGEVEVEDVAPGTATLSIRRQVEPSLELTALTAGILRGVLGELGAVCPRVQTPTCEALGDEATVFRVRWDAW
jgi:uncharacterized protein (TIGR02265 family)